MRPALAAAAASSIGDGRRGNRRKSHAVGDGESGKKTMRRAALSEAGGEFPEILYKYTSDAGVAGLREGIVRFGSHQEYRDAEDAQIQDVRENSILSRDKFVGTLGGQRVFRAAGVYFPGAVFCASLSDSLLGEFPRYSHRVMIRTKPLICALHRAMSDWRNIFEKGEHGGMIPVRLYDDHGKASWSGAFPNDDWEIVHPSKVRIELECDKVQYAEDMRSDVDPQEIISAASRGGTSGAEEIARLIPDGVKPEFVKGIQFSREEEYRASLSFSPWDEVPKRIAEHGKCYDVRRVYHTDSLFVKIENPRDVFSLPR